MIEQVYVTFQLQFVHRKVFDENSHRIRRDDNGIACNGVRRYRQG